MATTLYGSRRVVRRELPKATRETDALVVNNMGLVRPCARRYAGITGIDYDDLQSAGYVGLIRASRAFDPERGCRFSTIAVRYIQGAILQYIRDNGYGLKFPRRWRDKATRVRELAAQKGVTIEQIAEQTDLRPDEVDEILGQMKAVEAKDDLEVATSDPESSLDEDRDLLALRVLAQHAYEAVGVLDQPLLLSLSQSSRWPAGAVQRFDAQLQRAIGHSTIHAAAQRILHERQHAGLAPFCLGPLSVPPTPSPVSLEGRRQRQLRAEQSGQQTTLLQAAGSPSAAPAASSETVDPDAAASAAAAPAPLVPSVPSPPAADTGGKRPGRGRRSRRGASASARSQAAASSSGGAVDGPDVGWT